MGTLIGLAAAWGAPIVAMGCVTTPPQLPPAGKLASLMPERTVALTVVRQADETRRKSLFDASGQSLLSEAFASFSGGLLLFEDPSAPSGPDAPDASSGWSAMALTRFVSKDDVTAERFFSTWRPVVAHMTDGPILAAEPHCDNPDFGTIERIGEAEGVGIWAFKRREDDDDPMARAAGTFYLTIIDRQIAIMAFDQADVAEAIVRSKRAAPLMPAALASIASVVPPGTETYVIRTCNDPTAPTPPGTRRMVPFLSSGPRLTTSGFGMMYVPDDGTAYRLVVSPDAAAAELPELEAFINREMARFPPEDEVVKAITLSTETAGPFPHLKIHFDVEKMKNIPNAGMGLAMGVTQVYVQVFSPPPGLVTDAASEPDAPK